MNEKRFWLEWIEEEQVYRLLCNDEVLGKIPDDTTFANKILTAFMAQEELYYLKDKLNAVKHNIEFLYKDF